MDSPQQLSRLILDSGVNASSCVELMGGNFTLDAINEIGDMLTKMRNIGFTNYDTNTDATSASITFTKYETILWAGRPEWQQLVSVTLTWIMQDSIYQYGFKVDMPEWKHGNYYQWRNTDDKILDKLAITMYMYLDVLDDIKKIVQLAYRFGCMTWDAAHRDGYVVVNIYLDEEDDNYSFDLDQVMQVMYKLDGDRIMRDCDSWVVKSRRTVTHHDKPIAEWLWWVPATISELLGIRIKEELEHNNTSDIIWRKHNN